MFTKTVILDDRKFIVTFDDDNKPLLIKERKKYGQYPLDGWYNAPYWHHTHKLGSAKTLPFRIIQKALNKNA